MLPSLLHHLRAHRLIRPGETVVVAVSGGADSTALLHGLWFWQARLRCRLHVAHLHHGWRGAAADADAAWVAELAARRGLPCTVGRLPPRHTPGGAAGETAARAARYAFLGRVARATGAAAVAVAHHAGDQAETFLLNACRGAGTHGLAGMRPASDRPGFRLIRPLLPFSRETLRAFLSAHGLDWREDATNARPDSPRNILRLKALPLLRKGVNLRAGEALARAAGLLAEDDDALMRLGERARRRAQRGDDLAAAAVVRAHPAVRRRMLQSWLRMRGAGEPSAERLMRLEDRLRRPGDFTHELPGGCVRRCGAWLEWRARVAVTADGTTPPAAAKRPVTVRCPVGGAVRWPPSGATLRAAPVRRAARDRVTVPTAVGPAFAVVRADLLKNGALTIRARRPGDRFQAVGAPGRAKVQDIFTNWKVPRAERDRIPLALAGREIVWIPGYAVAAAWAIRPDTPPPWLRLTLSPPARRFGAQRRFHAGGREISAVT